MNELEIEARLRGIVIKNSRVPVRVVERGDLLAADLGFDSLAFLLTVGDLEEAYGITFPVERVDEIRDISFGQLLELVLAELAGRAPGR